MTDIISFLDSVLGIHNINTEFIYYIIGGAIVLISIDAILSFIFGGLSSIMRR